MQTDPRLGDHHHHSGWLEPPHQHAHHVDRRHRTLPLHAQSHLPRHDDLAELALEIVFLPGDHSVADGNQEGHEHRQQPEAIEGNGETDQTQRYSANHKSLMLSAGIGVLLSLGAAMRRRDFIKVVAGSAFTWPLVARAQQPATPVIGYLDSRSPEAVADRLRGLRQGLKETGYIEGENVAIAYRWAEDRSDRLPALATDLVRLPVAAIVAAGTESTTAAKAATTTIPIVFLVGTDPVQLGLATSLSRPGGNMTGINVFNSELAAKRLELLRDLLPQVTRIAVLVNPADVMITEPQLKEVTAAAQAMGLQIQVHNADTSAEISAAFEAMGRERPDAVFVAVSVFLNGRRIQLAQLAAFHRLPAIYALREYAEAGGLMSYGSNIAAGYRQAGIYVGRILKGAKPAELPVVQSNKFELVINAQTARMLGLTVPTSLLGRADEVIE